MRFRNLEKFRKGGTRARMELAVPVPRTPDGRVYQYSPNEIAHPRHFVIGGVQDGFVIDDANRARMKLEPRSEQTVCPYSGMIAANDDFLHPNDREAAIKTVEHAALEDMTDAVHSMFDGLERRQGPKSALTIQTSPRSRRMKPRFRRRDLLRELICDHCGRDYGVYAIALFCPDCGAPNLRLHFAREIELVLKQVALAEAGSENEELAYRLLGNAHEDVLTAFEATLKTVYLYRVGRLPPEAEQPRPVRNDFQNIEKAQGRFRTFQFDPFACLNGGERERLRLNIQKRHLIGHNLGVVDARFMEHAADARLGETVGLVGSDIKEFAALCERVVRGFDDWLVDGADTDAAAALPEPEPQGEEEAPPMNEPPETYGDLSKTATDLARWLCQTLKDGMCWPVHEDQLREAFPDVPPNELAEAIAELDADGFVTSSHLINRGLPRFRPTPDLFVTFDPIVLKSDPVADAAELIELVLAGPDSVSVPGLHTKTGWELRRFNPALSLILDRVDERRVSQSRDNHYPSSFFALMAEDRVALKRFAADLRE